ncbi:hypothetical protein GDO86_006243 [Hymenochirus boettgeri]|uniref:GIY-YIG domain-containing protein n=1 Tax=Hymenochirus boettgeri TaxID=247094 RepID=A0A8T2J9L5_9PIPI|nr:hypothetical protein GDO86_006243 [Hymenochirus boettgeri]
MEQTRPCLPAHYREKSFDSPSQQFSAGERDHNNQNYHNYDAVLNPFSGHVVSAIRTSVPLHRSGENVRFSVPPSVDLSQIHHNRGILRGGRKSLAPGLNPRPEKRNKTRGQIGPGSYGFGKAPYVLPLQSDTGQEKRKTRRQRQSMWQSTEDKMDQDSFDSFHPPHVKTSIVRSQFIRVLRITNDPILQDRRLNEMQARLAQRGYPRSLLTKERSILQPEKNKRDKENCLVFATKYNVASNEISHIIKKHWHILRQSYPDITEFQDMPIVAYKRATTIGNKLVKTDAPKKTPLTFLGTPKIGIFPCRSCVQCTFVQKFDRFVHPTTQRTYELKNFLTCDTDFCIYVLRCPCGLLYVGETTQKVKGRISQHRSSIRCGHSHLPVPQHYAVAGHSCDQLTFFVVEQICKQRRGRNRVLKLKQREVFWIHELNTLWPNGLNRDYDLYVYI